MNFLIKPNLNCKEDVDKIKEGLIEYENDQFLIVKIYIKQNLNFNIVEEIDKKLLSNSFRCYSKLNSRKILIIKFFIFYMKSNWIIIVIK